ncbi:PLP-dependent aminotransferase family protein [Ensifer sp. ENS11]|uniref:aminotransferase-like domain-containing protein n=1 Tax=Ensifer sp. ENS11 TaxID=2769291 RepID=UPI00177CD156|nr:PLP-dependent aminotransferase family protein [Ensifer sp. ENS11]MBD9490499.1 PLP-dependent aminotransferase family protein [Ensifer sp. ENS11]
MSTSTSQAWAHRFASRAKNIHASEIRDLFALLDNPEIISFAGGFPDADLFALPQFRDGYQKYLSDCPAASLQYCASEGYLPLRRWIAGFMHRQGVICTADNILITSGAQQAIEFLSRLFLENGDPLAISKPSYLGALQIFDTYEPSYRFFDGDGVGGTAQRPGNSQPLKLIYANPDFSNPTGETMDETARRRLLALARANDVPLIEDAAYSSLRYEGSPVPAIMQLDIAECGSIETSLVVYCGSFSKTMTPGIRIGWICAASPLIHKLALLKQSSDLNSSTINQMVIHRVAAETFDTCVSASRQVYRQKRDNLLSALGDYMPSNVTWRKPEGGMFVWLTLPEGLDAKRLLAKAITREGVAFVPGRPFHPDGSGENTLRLCFSSCPPERAREGILRLARLIAAEVAELGPMTQPPIETDSVIVPDLRA